ncbi:PREDICTED: uncharacterized protein LOC109179097 [Ipomoea nil]|uniref:uncharacterized protein LOC109179097 n=1 Tax=Ipomoea nil TaxID=35883 RepID=UPI000900EAB3|nr:PREDICTED: uncharacterized protein LOC109179097 [Ipomoea nil]
MTSRNYLFWRTQLLPFLDGQGLLGFIDGSTSCPLEESPVAAAGAIDVVSASPAAARAAWLRHDKAVLSLFISWLSEEMIHLAVGRTSSWQLWLSVEQTLGLTTRARALRLVLQALRQGDASIPEYLGRAQVLIEDLALVGRPVTLEDQNMYIFRGLRSEYRPLVALLMRSAPLSLSELSDFLVS